MTSISTLSAREFNQDTSRAKKLAADGPVFITDRGKPSHVLLDIQHYQQLASPRTSIVELLEMPEAAAVDLQLPTAGAIFAEADLP